MIIFSNVDVRKLMLEGNDVLPGIEDPITYPLQRFYSNIFLSLVKQCSTYDHILKCGCKYVVDKREGSAPGY